MAFLFDDRLDGILAITDLDILENDADFLEETACVLQKVSLALPSS